MKFLETPHYYFKILDHYVETVNDGIRGSSSVLFVSYKQKHATVIREILSPKCSCSLISFFLNQHFDFVFFLFFLQTHTLGLGIPLKGIQVQYGAGVHKTSDGGEETDVLFVLQMVQHALHGNKSYETNVTF